VGAGIQKREAVGAEIRKRREKERDLLCTHIFYELPLEEVHKRYVCIKDMTKKLSF